MSRPGHRDVFRRELVAIVRQVVLRSTNSLPPPPAPPRFTFHSVASLVSDLIVEMSRARGSLKENNAEIVIIAE